MSYKSNQGILEAIQNDTKFSIRRTYGHQAEIAVYDQDDDEIYFKSFGISSNELEDLQDLVCNTLYYVEQDEAG